MLANSLYGWDLAMTNRPGKRKARGRFSEAEICRVLRAIKKTGVAMEIRIEPEGGIHIFPSDRPLPPDEATPKKNSWSDFRV